MAAEELFFLEAERSLRPIEEAGMETESPGNGSRAFRERTGLGRELARGGTGCAPPS